MNNQHPLIYWCPYGSKIYRVCSSLTSSSVQTACLDRLDFSAHSLSCMLSTQPHFSVWQDLEGWSTNLLSIAGQDPAPSSIWPLFRMRSQHCPEFSTLPSELDSKQEASWTFCIHLARVTNLHHELPALRRWTWNSVNILHYLRQKHGWMVCVSCRVWKLKIALIC